MNQVLMIIIISIPSLLMNRSAFIFKVILTVFNLLVHQAYGSSEITTENDRQGKDLIYEAMKMRTGNWKTWDPNRVQIVGGGILEKRILGERGGVEEHEGPQYESRGKIF